MAFTTYSGLKDTIATWLSRTDSSDDLNTNIDDFIDLAEERLARDFRIRAMEATLVATIASGVATVPTNFLELKRVHIAGDPVRPLEPKESTWILDHYPIRTSDRKPIFIAEDGGTFIFGPFPDSNYVVEGFYYKKPTALSGSNTTNEWTSNIPDALLWACLLETAPFIMNDQRIPIWASKYQEAKDRIMRAERKRTRRFSRIGVS